MNYRCPLCAGEFQSPTAGMVRCPHCGGEILVDVQVPEGCAWDREHGGQWAQAFVADLKASLADPLAFFAQVGAGRGWVRPWCFALIISVAAFFIAAAYQAGFQALALGPHIGNLLSAAMQPFAVLSLPVSIAVVGAFAIIGIPIVTTAALAVQTLLYHICLMLLGAARRDIGTTFRVVCYSMGPQLFQIVPLVGGMIAGAWQLVLAILGLKVVHGTSYARSALAVFLPMLACCSVILLTLMAIFGWTFAAILSAAH
jgi:DNA-directed RNA polymerase subunit RPC12/RpoP